MCFDFATVGQLAAFQMSVSHSLLINMSLSTPSFKEKEQGSFISITQRSFLHLQTVYQVTDNTHPAESDQQWL